MDKLPFYELEELVDSLKMLAEKEEEERNKKDGNNGNGFSMSQIQSQMKSMMPSNSPSFPNMKF